MASINLLPWREGRRDERQKQFVSMLIFGFVFAALILYAGILSVDINLDEQYSRNNLLQSEIRSLDQKIQEISTLEDDRARLITRMDVIQELQLSRPKIVKVFDALARVLPEGVYLEKVKKIDGNLILNGIAQSNARVSVFMQNLEEHSDFEEPKLQIVQRTATKEDNQSIRKFTLLVRDLKDSELDGGAMKDEEI